MAESEDTNSSDTPPHTMAGFGAVFDAELNKIRSDLKHQLQTDLQQQLQQHLQAGSSTAGDRVALLSIKVDELQDALAKTESKIATVHNELNAEQKTSKEYADALKAAQKTSNDLAATVNGSLATMSATITKVIENLHSLQQRFDDESDPVKKENFHELKSALEILSKQYSGLKRMAESNQSFIDAMAQVGATHYPKSMARRQQPLGATTSFTSGRQSSHKAHSVLTSHGADEETPQSDPEPSNTKTSAKRTAHERRGSSSSDGNAKKVQRRRAISNLKESNFAASGTGTSTENDIVAAAENNGLLQALSHAQSSPQTGGLQSTPATGPLAQFLRKATGEVQADDDSSSSFEEEDSTIGLEPSGALRRSNRALKPRNMDDTVDISKLKPSQLGRKERMG